MRGKTILVNKGALSPRVSTHIPAKSFQLVEHTSATFVAQLPYERPLTTAVDPVADGAAGSVISKR
jgi:hypothetical protein